MTARICTGCGQPLPPTAKFCPECGARAPLPRTGMEAEVAAAPAGPTLSPGLRSKIEAARAELSGDRREVAVLFADLKGFTAMSERLDPEEVTLLINRLLQSLAGAVYDYEGYVDKFIGDAIMALFGAPLAHENDPERAVLAGLAMLDVVARHNEAADVSEALAIRVGINLGEVVAAQIGSEMRQQYTVLGDTVNVASRLENAAESNTVLVSEAVYARVADRFEAEELPPLDIRGKSEPVRAYRILAYRPPAGPRAVETPFVGRGEELERIGGLLDRAQAGESGALLIEGDAGIGKSRLVREALERRGDGMTKIEIGFSVIRRPGHRSPAVEIFCQIIGDSDGEGSAEDRALAILGELADEHRHGVRGLAWDSDPSRGEASPEADPQAARQNRWLAAAALIEASARERPVALVVENLQWADEAAREFLAFLIPAASDHPVAALLTGRPAEWTWLPDSVDRLTIGPLDARAVEAMLGEFLDDIAPEDRRDLIQRSAGNPLYLEELTRALRAEPAGAAPRSVPGSVQGLILSRIDRLPGPVQLLLQMGSILGGRFPIALLDRMYELEAQPTAFRQALEVLQDEGFLETDVGDRAGEARFPHALMQEVTYGGLLQRIRRVLHESAARLGEEHFAGRAAAEAPFFAHHWWYAGQPRAAGPHLWIAGRVAAAEYDLPSAEKYLRRAAEALEADDGIISEPEERARFEETLGTVLLQRGDLDTAETRFRRLEEQGASGDMAAWRARGMELRGRIAWYRGQLEQAQRLFESGLSTLPESEERIAADLHNDLGIVFYYRGQVEDAFARHSEALLLRERRGDRLGTVKSLLNIGNVLLHHRNDLDGAEHSYRRAYETAQAIGDRQLVFGALNNLGLVAIERGRWREAIDTFKTAERLLEDIGWPFMRYLTLQNRAWCEIMLGRIADALRHLQICLERGDTVLEPVNRMTTRVYLFDAYLKAMAEERAQSLVREARRLAEELGVDEDEGEVEMREGRWLAATGEWRQAAAAFAAAEDAARRLNQAALLVTAKAHRCRAEARAGGGPAEACDDPTGANVPLATLVRYLNADAQAADRPTAECAEALAEVARQADELGEVGLARAAGERLAEVRRALGDEDGAREALAGALAAMEALAAGLPGDLREGFLAHPRNARLLECAGPRRSLKLEERNPSGRQCSDPLEHRPGSGSGLTTDMG
ncbi:MAG TPA: adenylate/guanylate cyclase domain-containing protein [Gemmatimonadota bacterium]|nr:adenylate/guanylate cyclase domain-containing protein [Gemmatimonadota bacterium]